MSRIQNRLINNLDILELHISELRKMIITKSMSLMTLLLEKKKKSANMGSTWIIY